jgi:hypothetical protein
MAIILFAFKPMILPEHVASTGKGSDQENANRLRQPYTATFAELLLYSHRHASQKPAAAFTYRKPEEKRVAVSVSALAWLLEKFPKAWPHNLTKPSSPVLFVGFNPRLFLDILGTECSLPKNQTLDEEGKPRADVQSVAPLSLWLNDCQSLDIMEAVKPARYPNLSWQQVLKARGLLDDDQCPRGGLVSATKEPHQDVNKDLVLIGKLADQLGLLTMVEEEKSKSVRPVLTADSYLPHV